ncbi:MAG: anti-sigma-I factor RsgI family protein [Bacillota bacterium]
MTKIKGLVVKTEGRHMWVATEDRQFRRYPLPATGAAIGQEVWVEQPVPAVPYFASRGALVAGLVVMIFLGAFLWQLVPGGTPVAYLAVDINPSLEIALDGAGRVLEVEPLNREAKLLVKNLSPRKKDVYTFLDRIIQKAEYSGYLKPGRDNLVLVTIIPARDGAPVPVNAFGVKEVVLKSLAARNVQGQVGIQNASLEERIRAREAGLSVNHYLLSTRAAEKGVLPGPTVKDKAGIQEILNRLSARGIPLEQLVVEFGVTAGPISNQPPPKETLVNPRTVPPGSTEKTTGNPEHRDARPAEFRPVDEDEEPGGEDDRLPEDEEEAGIKGEEKVDEADEGEGEGNEAGADDTLIEDEKDDTKLEVNSHDPTTRLPAPGSGDEQESGPSSGTGASSKVNDDKDDARDQSIDRDEGQPDDSSKQESREAAKEDAGSDNGGDEDAGAGDQDKDSGDDDERD